MTARLQLNFTRKSCAKLYETIQHFRSNPERSKPGKQGIRSFTFTSPSYTKIADHFSNAKPFLICRIDSIKNSRPIHSKSYWPGKSQLASSFSFFFLFESYVADVYARLWCHYAIGIQLIQHNPIRISSLCLSRSHRIASKKFPFHLIELSLFFSPLFVGPHPFRGAHNCVSFFSSFSFL